MTLLPRQEAWETQWGATFDKDFKEKRVYPILRELAARGEIGEVILDIGSGEHSLASAIPGNHKRITIDLCGDESRSNNTLHLPFDIENISENMSEDVRTAITKVANFLTIDCKKTRQPKQVDCMIFSEIINYIDYKNVIKGLTAYVKPGGRIIILNRPRRGFDKLFSHHAPKDNFEILATLEENGYFMERMTNLQFRDEGIDKEMVLIVASLDLESQ